LLEFTITTKQLIAAIWTLIAIVLSLVTVIALAITIPIPSPLDGWPWVAVFFGLLLVMTLPVYLLLALWQVLAKSDTT